MPTPQEQNQRCERRSFVVTGLVQGVGFRPFVHRLAAEFGLAGFVLNHAGDVHVEAEGAPSALLRFERALRRRAPPLAQIDQLRTAPMATVGRIGFSIESSTVDEHAQPLVAPDVATCERCLSELFDPSDRRYHYPFSNCTDCGPRLTIIEDVPYDRERTTMRAFELCRECRAEYEEPTNRRFHAEPNACAACGPALELLGPDGERLAAARPLEAAAQALLAERIVAVKGIGGFHLACMASSERATGELRRRKAREQRPFALLVRTLHQARELCELDELGRELLTSPARPIVLAPRRTTAAVANAVAGSSPLLGVMLAYTPLQHLLCRAVGDAPLVMTSGNPSHEPIAFEDEDARARLNPLCDRILSHNRPIHVSCDDSVVRSLNGAPSTLRRARGLAPRPCPLGQRVRRPLLALGAQDNATFALARGDQALVSHHLGDLGNATTLAAYRARIEHYERLFRVRPERLIHDLHPDYASSRLAHELARERGLSLLAVQHHHAHVVSCMVEHGLHGSVLGLACDGTGLGDDGTIWGGEWLLCERASARRVAHFRCVPMPGGERAVHEPWRMALAHLLDAGLAPDALGAGVERPAVRVVSRMIERGFNCPLTSSVGRLFDAVSALCGIRLRASYEGQAAIELEWAALRAVPSEPLTAYSFRFERVALGAPVQVDTRPLIRDLVSDLQAGLTVSHVARRFHHTLALIGSELCQTLAAEHGVSRVVLAGGVFANEILVGELEHRLTATDLRVFRAQAYPAGDGGLSLGQLGIGAAWDARDAQRAGGT